MLERTEVDAGAATAFAIQFSVGFPNNRSMTITTAIPQDCSDLELRKLIRRMSDATESLDNVYKLRTVKEEIERWDRELANVRQQIDLTSARHQREFEASGRKGAFKLTKPQQSEARNFESTEQRVVDTIRKLRDEVKSLEKSICADEAANDG